MDIVVTQIHTLSTDNESDLKKLRDFLRHEQERLKTNIHQIDGALQTLDPTANTLGVAFLLSTQCSLGVFANPASTFSYIGNFLTVADEQQAKKASVPLNFVCKCYARMAVEDGQRSMMRALKPLRCAVEKLRPNPETLTPVHAEFLRVCLKAKAYHVAASLLDQPIFDIDVNGGACAQLTPQSFLCFFFYGALIRIGLKQYVDAMRLLLVVLTCPASCLSAIQADAYKKYVLVSLLIHGELKALPVYSSHIVQRYAKNPGYALDIVEAFKQGDPAGLQRVVDEKSQHILADQSLGLVKQVATSLRRHKAKMLTNTYLTLSLAEITKQIGLEEDCIGEVEELLFDMVSKKEIIARIDQSTGNVSFEDGAADTDLGPEVTDQLQLKMSQILMLTERIAAFEQEVVSSEAYVRKTTAPDGDRSGAVAAALGGFDFMDM